MKNYSSGMYVRLGFSVAINVDPDILLIDEVLAVGDAEFQRKCSEKFADFRKQGKTIVIVSHSLPSVRALCDEVALLEHGQLRDLGPAGRVIDHYLADAFADQDDAGGLRRGGARARFGSSGSRCSTRGGGSSHARDTGDAVTFRIHYNAREPVRDVQFGTALNNVEGVAITGPNTRARGPARSTASRARVTSTSVPRLTAPAPGQLRLHRRDLRPRRAPRVRPRRARAVRFEVEAGEPVRGSRRRVARRDVGGRRVPSS